MSLQMMAVIHPRKNKNMKRFIMQQLAEFHYQSVSCLSKDSIYVNDTVIPTYHFQKSLPRLPIPKLEDTMRKYIEAVEPVVSSKELKETKQVASEFEKGVGKILHDDLIQRDKKHLYTSYINQWWLDMYVSDRQPLMINVNPQITIKDDENMFKNAQDQRAASLIASTLRFYCTLRDGKLEPDIFHTQPKYSKTNWFKQTCCLIPESFSFYGAAAFGAYPLDMSQYKKLFQSTRIPRKDKDKLISFSNSKHIIIQRGCDFYKLNVLNKDEMPISDDSILNFIQIILHKTPIINNKINGIGLLTTLNRDEWAEERKKLIEYSSTNAASLHDIDSSLFIVSLEETSPKSRVEISRCFLHGQGNNRFFDKSFQLIIAANGKASVNFEHSWGDGIAILRYLNELYQDTQRHSSFMIKSSFSSSSNLQLLKWKLNDDMIETLNKAKQKFQKWTQRLLMACGETNISRAIGKKYDIGVDGVMQMCIQYAHYQLHGNFVATYESASTSAFKHGRTETVRSCTNAAVVFCKTMSNPSASAFDKVNALRKAVNQHQELTKAAVMGQGFDRHLFGLLKMAHLHKIETPLFYQLNSYKIMNKIILSTSTLSSPYLEGGCFGPVNEDCYGVGYGIEDGSLFQLASYRKDVNQFRDLLVKSLLEIDALLLATRSN